MELGGAWRFAAWVVKGKVAKGGAGCGEGWGSGGWLGVEGGEEVGDGVLEVEESLNGFEALSGVGALILVCCSAVRGFGWDWGCPAGPRRRRGPRRGAEGGV